MLVKLIGIPLTVSTPKWSKAAWRWNGSALWRCSTWSRSTSHRWRVFLGSKSNLGANCTARMWQSCSDLKSGSRTSNKYNRKSLRMIRTSRGTNDLISSNPSPIRKTNTWENSSLYQSETCYHQLMITNRWRTFLIFAKIGVNQCLSSLQVGINPLLRLPMLRRSVRPNLGSIRLDSQTSRWM